MDDQAIVTTDDDGIRLDRWFKRHREGTPHALIARWARSGQLTIDGRRADVSDRLSAGQTLAMPSPPTAATPRAARDRPALDAAETAFARSLVLHQDASALVLDKPPGLATQGGTKTDEHVDGLLDALQFDAKVRPKLVHRLDKDTSGALLIARTPRSAAFFAKAFSNRSARKTYWAIVVGVPAINQGEIDLPLAKQPGTGGEKMHVDDAGAHALTRYRVLDRAGNEAAWVELQPLTGRTHQLRVHMAAIGHPIVGDGKYGGKAAFLTGTISRKMHLHARRLRIDHPDGGKLDITAPLPDHFAASVDSLGFDLLYGDLAASDDGEKRPPSAIAAKVRAKAHSKQIRKERRGERRGRAEVNAERPAKTAKAKSPAKSTKPPARSEKPARPAKTGVAAKPPRPARPTGKTTRPAGKPAGKPASPRKVR